MPEFTMNGYKDLEDLAQELKDEGYYWAQDKPGGIVAVVSQKLLKRATRLLKREAQEQELLMGVSGIVSCAIDDGLIDEED